MKFLLLLGTLVVLVTADHPLHSHSHDIQAPRSSYGPPDIRQSHAAQPSLRHGASPVPHAPQGLTPDAGIQSQIHAANSQGLSPAFAGAHQQQNVPQETHTSSQSFGVHAQQSQSHLPLGQESLSSSQLLPQTRTEQHRTAAEGPTRVSSQRQLSLVTPTDFEGLEVNPGVLLTEEQAREGQVGVAISNILSRLAGGETGSVTVSDVNVPPQGSLSEASPQHQFAQQHVQTASHSQLQQPQFAGQTSHHDSAANGQQVQQADFPVQQPTFASPEQQTVSRSQQQPSFIPQQQSVPSSFQQPAALGSSGQPGVRHGQPQSSFGSQALAPAAPAQPPAFRAVPAAPQQQPSAPQQHSDVRSFEQQAPFSGHEQQQLSSSSQQSSALTQQTLDSVSPQHQAPTSEQQAHQLAAAPLPQAAGLPDDGVSLQQAALSPTAQSFSPGISLALLTGQVRNFIPPQSPQASRQSEEHVQDLSLAQQPTSGFSVQETGITSPQEAVPQQPPSQFSGSHQPEASLPFQQQSVAGLPPTAQHQQPTSFQAPAFAQPTFSAVQQPQIQGQAAETSFRAAVPSGPIAQAPRQSYGPPQ